MIQGRYIFTWYYQSNRPDTFRSREFSCTSTADSGTCQHRHYTVHTGTFQYPEQKCTSIGFRLLLVSKLFRNKKKEASLAADLFSVSSFQSLADAHQHVLHSSGSLPVEQSCVALQHTSLVQQVCLRSSTLQQLPSLRSC